MEGAAEEDVTDELARLLALKLRLAADTLMGATAEGPLLPLPALPMGGLTAMAGLTAAEWSLVAAVAAPGVDAPPEDERQSAVVATPLAAPGEVIPAPVALAVGEMSSPLVPPLGVGDVTPKSCKRDMIRRKCYFTVTAMQMISNLATDPITAKPTTSSIPLIRPTERI